MTLQAGDSLPCSSSGTIAHQMARASHSELRIAIDTGGTFTDCVWVERGVLKTLKVFSTPDDPSRAIGEALRKIGGATPLTLLHGTTVGTNALLQRKGARVALITTSGFEDVIENRAPGAASLV